MLVLESLSAEADNQLEEESSHQDQVRLRLLHFFLQLIDKIKIIIWETTAGVTGKKMILLG